MTKAIYFDMDGTLANLYNVPNWLEKLQNEDATPYTDATPLLRLSTLARLLNKLIAKGYTVNIISWLAKNSSEEYDAKVIDAKLTWLTSHLASVNFTEIIIVKYGTPKELIVNFPDGILFDDEIANRENWKGTAYDVNNIIEILKGLE